MRHPKRYKTHTNYPLTKPLSLFFYVFKICIDVREVYSSVITISNWNFSQCHIVLYFRCLEWEVINATTTKSDEFYDKGNYIEQSNHTMMMEDLFNSTLEIDDDDVETIEFSLEDNDSSKIDPVPLQYCTKFVEDLEQPLQLQLVKNLKF